MIKSLAEPTIDTTRPMGRALFGIVAEFAQLREGTIRSGLDDARREPRRRQTLDDHPIATDEAGRAKNRPMS